MNWLAIAQRIRQECGIPGNGPSLLTGQSGELARVISWMSSAYEDIQATHSTWEFLRFPFSFVTAVGVDIYGASQHLITDLSEWDLDTFRCYSAIEDEQPLDFYPWEQFRDTWKLGTSRARSGRPICFSVKPDNTITFDCVPDAIYTINGEYYKLPVAIGAEADSPIFPAHHHMAIVYRALMMYAAREAEPDKYAFGMDEYRKILARMEITLLPIIEEGPPLA
jgi:hypothetical protein